MPEEFDVNGTTVAGYLALPERGHGPGVLVLHAWWGLTPFFEDVCERLATEGFVAFAPDRYGGPTAATIEEAEALQRQREDWVSTEAALRASVEFLGAHEAVDGEGLGALGFSAGAAWALLLSVREPKSAKGRRRLLRHSRPDRLLRGAGGLSGALRRGRRVGANR